MEIYKGYEIFFDDCYYGMIAVRPVGCRDFNKTQHVCSEAEAKAYVNSILRDGNKIGAQKGLGEQT